MQTEQIDEIRDMFRNDDGSCKLSRSDVLRIVDKLAEFKAAQQERAADLPKKKRKKGKYKIKYVTHTNPLYESASR